MNDARNEGHIHRLLDEIYGAAVSPERWSTVLASLAATFHGSFADIFTRSLDKQHYHGLAHGLDKSDYDDVFLGFWFKRNIWGNTKPVRIAGEVISTRDIIDIGQLTRSEIYENYLGPRDLHEGLRLSLWVDENDIQDISILRPWSAGAFDADDVEFGQFLLPHLQRAAAVTRRLRQMEIATEAGIAALDASKLAVFLFDADGLAVSLNAMAEKLIADGRLLTLTQGRLQASMPGQTRDLNHAVAQAVGRAGSHRCGSLVRLSGIASAGHANLMVLPISGREDWAFARPAAGMALMRGPSDQAVSEERLAGLFGLTPAESDLAKHLLAGLQLREIASTTERSLHTVRNHMSRLMSKTQTKKQGELIRLLIETEAFGDLAPPRAAGREPPRRRLI